MTTFILFMIDLFSRALYFLGKGRAIAIGRALGAFAYHVVRIRRRVVLGNLKRSFPEKTEAERRTIAVGCYRQLGRILMEALLLQRMTEDEIAKTVRFHNEDQFRATLAEGKGIIACMGHMGNWELLGFAGGRRGYTLHAVTKVLKGALNQRLHATRRKAFKELPPSGSFDRGLEVLSRGEILGLIVDQHRAGDKAVIIDFFGQPAATSPSPALFSLRSGAPVFTSWMTLADDGIYDVELRGPFPVPDAPTLQERLVKHTQLIADELEQVIRRHPSQWFWVHRRWKVGPRPVVATPPAAADNEATLNSKSA